MVDLKPITDAILADAALLAEKIKKDTESLIEELRREAEEERKRIKDSFEKKITDEIEQIHSAKTAEIRDITRTRLLKIKAEAAKSTAHKAVDRICTGDEEYLEFIKKLIKKAEPGEGNIVYLNRTDKKRLDKSMFAPAKVSDECINTKGGFKMTGEYADFDMTCEAILEESFDEICDRINEIYEAGEAG